MSMDTEYCSKCGLLHNPNDGDCLGCEKNKQIKKLESRIVELCEEHETNISRLEKANKKLVSEHQIMRMSYNSICDDLHNGEHIDMEWVKSSIAEAGRDRAVGALNTKIAKLEGKRDKTIAKLREALEFYGDEDHWCKDKFTARDLEFGMFGGKRARTTLQECFEKKEK